MVHMIRVTSVVSNLVTMLLVLYQDPDSFNQAREFLYHTYKSFFDDVFHGPIWQSHDYQISLKKHLKDYEFEEHIVYSQGYHLKMYHIFNKDQDPSAVEPVLLMHGLMDQGSTWFVQEKENNMVFKMLENKSYDIWIPNSRESIQTVARDNYTDMDKDYWDFTFYEMAKYDIPAFVDYVLVQTGKDQLSYIGHSQGTLTFFLASALHGTDFTSKIRNYVALSPVLSIKHAHNGASVFLDGFSLVDLLKQDSQHFTRFSPFIKNLVLPIITQYMPRSINNNIQSLIGRNIVRQHIPLERLAVITRYSFGGLGTKNLWHFNQVRLGGDIRMFDYDDYQKNIKVYGTSVPPAIKVDNLKDVLKNVNILILSGNQDSLIQPPDADAAVQLMPKNAQFVMISDYNHMDLLWASDSHLTIQPLIFKFLENNQAQE